MHEKVSLWYNYMKTTLKELIQLRQSKYDGETQNKTYSEFWQGYMDGWCQAYKDLLEILNQNDFDTNVIVIHDECSKLDDC